jgi:hypothetical protein
MDGLSAKNNKECYATDIPHQLKKMTSAYSQEFYFKVTTINSNTSLKLNCKNFFYS